MSYTVSVIGTVFIDCKGFAQQKYLPSGRNLGNIGFIHGGVGRNVAENMANLGLPIIFVSSVDNSALGTEVIDRLKSANIDTTYIAKADHHGMGMWLAILDEHGNLAGSISQMPDVVHMENTIRLEGEAIVHKSSHIILELDLNEEISRNVIRLGVGQNKPIYGIPGNLDVILKNRDMLKPLDCFICNNFEADRLLDLDFTKISIEEKINALIQFVDSEGPQSLVVTLGELGSVYYDSKTKESGYQPVFPVHVVDTSGAGDAFFSGTVMGLIRDLPLSKAVVAGTKVAGWTIESKESNCRELQNKMEQDEFFQAWMKANVS